MIPPSALATSPKPAPGQALVLAFLAQRLPPRAFALGFAPGPKPSEAPKP